MQNHLNVIVLGDSLIAGYGLLEKDGFVTQLQQKMNTHNIKVKLINGGVSGETSQDIQQTRMDFRRKI